MFSKSAIWWKVENPSELILHNSLALSQFLSEIFAMELHEKLRHFQLSARKLNLQQQLERLQAELCLVDEQLDDFRKLPAPTDGVLDDTKHACDVVLPAFVKSLRAGDKMWYCEKKSRIYRKKSIQEIAHDGLNNTIFVEFTDDQSAKAIRCDTMLCLPCRFGDLSEETTVQFYQTMFDVFQTPAMFSPE